jgi:hypothetical protein
MGRDIQGPLIGLQSSNDPETGLIDRTLGLLGIFEGHPDLITEFRAFVLLEIRERLREIILKEVEKCSVVILGHATVLQKQRTIGDQCLGSLRVEEVSIIIRI